MSKELKAKKTEKEVNLIKDLNAKVLKYFGDMCEVIPRGSKKETEMCNHLKKYCDGLKANGIDAEFYHQQEIRENKPINNIIITVPASEGYEKAETIAFQAHMDMVCQPQDSSHNFDKEFIETEIKGNLMTSKGMKTTLGADDAIGIACIMALLEDKRVLHPRIEAIFTSDEEDGMSGAKWLDKDRVSATRFINIDAETEGVLYYGCAGGIYANISLPAIYTNAPEGIVFYEIKVTGLMGGHSGLKIIEGRPNANRLMGRALNYLLDDFSKTGTDVILASINGGTAKNAIPKEAVAVVAVRECYKDRLINDIEDIEQMFKYEYSALEPNLSVKSTFRSENEFERVLSQETMKKVVTLLMTLPNGVLDMSTTVDGLVETSSNIGVVTLDGNTISINDFVRSSIESKKKFVTEQIRIIAESVGAGYVADTEFPEWNPDVNSGLLHLFGKTMKEIWPEREVISESVHAGLECGYFFKKFYDPKTQKSVDLIAVGPTIDNAHVPQETLHLDTIPKLLELLVKVLGKMNDENCYEMNSNDKNFAVMKRTLHTHTHNCNCMI